MRTRWQLGLWIAALCGWSGCQAPRTAVYRASARLVEDARRELPPLAEKPLYAFSDDEIDRYVGWLHARERSLRARIMHLARKAIGQRYEIYLLGEFPFEGYDPDPLYNFARSDCLTFCEHMYALAMARDFGEFVRILQRIRYRDGIVGMLTRNHYTIADWDRNNAFFLEDVTTKLGGGRVHVPLHQVVRRSRFFAKFGLGQDIPDQPVTDAYIPKASVPQILDELRDADFVNIIRGNEQSQYCGHTGLIAIGPDGQVNFLHSARPQVREEPLVGYLQRDQRSLGIKILRLRPAAERLMRRALASTPEATDVSDAALHAALKRWPLHDVLDGPCYGDDWKKAMRFQAYRLEYDTPTDAALQSQLEALDAGVRDALGIGEDQRAFGVLDLTDLRFAAIRPDAIFYGASVPKIAILLAYFETHPQAAETLDPQTGLELKRMIKRSDNALAAKYSQLVGLERIRQILQSDKYRLYDPARGGLWCGKHYGIDEPRVPEPLSGHSHAMTVRQALRYYLLLEQGRLVSPQASAKIKQIFAAPELDFHAAKFVRGLAGRDVSLIRKSGWWEDWHLDTARVRHGDRVYLLAGATHHPHGGEYLARMAAGVDELLCGPSQPVRDLNLTILHDSWDDFAPGTMEHARLDPGRRGVLLEAGPDAPAVYTSAPLSGPFWFNEVLVSWNVATPAGAGFCVELRVGRGAEGFWSPWLRVGEFGDVVPDVPIVTQFDDAADEVAGRIDVDYFRSDDRFDRVQYRILAASGAQKRTLRIERVAVTLSDRTGLPYATPRWKPSFEPLPPSAWQKTLPVPQRSQKAAPREIAGRICSPTSVAMVLGYYGIERDTLAVAQACYDPRHDLYGNWPRNIQAAYMLGVPGYLTRISDWRQAERFIADGTPLVISIRVPEAGMLNGSPYRTTDGHLLVLTGFEGDAWVTVNDPAAERDVARRYRRSELERVWLRGAGGGLAYVLLPPAGHTE